MSSLKETPAWFQYPRFNWKHKQATVIGGGIAGAQATWHLCQKGWQVTLIERHKTLATEASGNPAGVLSPKMTAIHSEGEDFYTRSFHYTLSLLKTLKQQGQSIDWEACGVLQLAHSPREIKRWQSLKERGLPKDFIQLLDNKQTTAVSGVGLPYKASYFPHGGWIKPASFVKALASHPNCSIIYQSLALSLNKADKQWQVLDADNRMIAESDAVIIANGKDLFQFKQSNFLPGLAVAGQTTTASTLGYSKKLKTVIGHDGYLTPLIRHNASNTKRVTKGVTKKHIFGATFERGIQNPTLEQSADYCNFTNLQLYLPNLANALTDINSAHTAVRMTTPDRFPYVGGLPEKAFYQESYHDLHQGKQWKEYPKAKYQDGLFVLGGLGSRGLITSGYCAKSLVALIENNVGAVNNKETDLVLKQCHPARFLIKDLKKNRTIS